MSYVPTLPRSLSTQGVLGRALRRGLLNRRLHRIVGSRVQATLVRLAYLGRFSQWVDEHALEPGFRSRLELYDHLVRSEGLEAGIDYLEFGVFQGASIRWWSERIADPAARFVGFDTFEGLPEAWAGEPAGGLTAGGRVPEVADTRVRFETGLFQDTLPRFLERTARTRRLVVNLDADLYSSTLFVLSSLAPRLKQHDLLVFDEMGSLREPAHEFRAFLDFAAAYRFGYRPIAASPVYKVVAIRLESDVVPRPAGLP